MNKRIILNKYIVADPKICHGKPTFKGTRIMVWQVLQLLAAGESVESILTILASSLLGVATFSVGAMVTAYTSVSSAASPRVAALVTSDEETQKSLATFVGAFLYAIVSVTAINAHYYGQNGRAILFLFSLAMVGLVAFRLLAWINRLSSLARVGHMIELVESYARDALEQRRDLPRLGGRAGGLAAGRPSGREGGWVYVLYC